MNCTEARSALLTCELADLASDATGPLAQHVGECADCRVRANLLVARTTGLRSLVIARGAVRAQRALTRRRVVGGLAVAAGLVAIAVLARRAPLLQEKRDRVPITIENAQGRAVTVIERRDTIDVIFYAPESE